VANGQLQDALVPPAWKFAGQDGSFAVFADHDARSELSVRALSDGPATGSSVRILSGTADQPSAAAVRSRHGVRLIRSVAAIPGWTATWHPRNGQARALAVRRAGVVQSVDIPPGSGVVTWSYAPPRFIASLALSLGALAVLLLLAALWSRGLLAGRSRAARPSRRIPARSSGKDTSHDRRVLGRTAH
jgi:hypothetical protein